MDSTYATLIVSAADRDQAHTDLADQALLSIPLSANGAEPVTHYAASGWFLNAQLDFIANDATWPHTLRFGRDLDGHLADAGLQVVSVIPE